MVDKNRKKGANSSHVDPKSTRTRQRILDAAAQVLSVKGYASTRLSDIAAIAELKTPAIYYYFDSREELLAEVIWVGINDVRVEVRAALAELPADATSLDRLRVAVSTHLRWVLDSSDYTKASIRNAAQMPEQLTRRYQREADIYGQLWAGILSDMRDEGALREGLDPFEARMLMIGALNWAPEWWDGKRGTLETVINTASVMMVNALGTNRQTQATGR